MLCSNLHISYIICLLFRLFLAGEQSPPTWLEVKDLTNFSPAYGLHVSTSSDWMLEAMDFTFNSGFVPSFQ